MNVKERVITDRVPPGELQLQERYRENCSAHFFRKPRNTTKKEKHTGKGTAIAVLSFFCSVKLFFRKIAKKFRGEVLVFTLLLKH